MTLPPQKNFPVTPLNIPQLNCHPESFGIYFQRCQPSLFQREVPYFLKHFLSILTLNFGSFPISGKFCAIEVTYNFENLFFFVLFVLVFFCLNPHYFWMLMLASLYYSECKHQMSFTMVHSNTRNAKSNIHLCVLNGQIK